MIDTIITNATIITMEAAGEILWRSAIAIQDGSIIDIGETTSIEAKYPDAGERIDAAGNLVMPGLINAHTHIAMSLFRGLYAADPDSIYKVMFPIESCLEPDDILPLALAGAVECMKGGSTCIADHYYYIEQVAQSVEKAGLRGVLGHTIADRLAPFTGRAQLNNALAFVEKWKGHPRIKPLLAPHSPETTAIETLKTLKRIAERENLLVHIHVAQSPRERRYVRNKYGMTSVELLDSLGYVNDSMIAAHCAYVERQDIRLMADKGAAVVFCPSSQASYLYQHITPAPEFLLAGARVLVGTDAVAGSGHMSLIDELKIASSLQLVRKGALGRISPQKLLQMVTIDAARAFKIDDQVGSLRPGKKADLLFINLNKAEMAPINDLYALVVYSIASPNISRLMVCGKTVYSNGKVTGIDEGDLVRQVEQVKERVLGKARARFPELGQALGWI